MDGGTLEASVHRNLTQINHSVWLVLCQQPLLPHSRGLDVLILRKETCPDVIQQRINPSYLQLIVAHVELLQGGHHFESRRRPEERKRKDERIFQREQSNETVKS